MRTTTRQASRKGFTLIELLIVVVIIGILAAVAIPKFSNTKEKAYVSSMKSDLKNLVSTQESFFADSSKYADKASIEKNPYTYKTSQGTSVTAINGDATGWSAHITNQSVSGAQKDCRVFGGTGTAADQNKGSAKDDGVPYCGA
jgi:prepilin-type N-terminal cleavage/methylation domain-containing protein